eukprot:4696246-Amphidinium_carterae.1
MVWVSGDSGKLNSLLGFPSRWRRLPGLPGPPLAYAAGLSCADGSLLQNSTHITHHKEQNEQIKITNEHNQFATLKP